MIIYRIISKLLVRNTYDDIRYFHNWKVGTSTLLAFSSSTEKRVRDAYAQLRVGIRTRNILCAWRIIRRLRWLMAGW